MIKLSIETGNAAFEDGYKELEAARIIAEAANKVENEQFDFKLYDINGNVVGRLMETFVEIGDPLELEPGENYITLEIDTGNAAFEDSGKGYECARILREAAAKLRDGDLGFKLRDVNGNSVGKVEEVVGNVANDAVTTGERVALLVGSLEHGFAVQSILAESDAEDAVVRLLADGKLAEAIHIVDPSKDDSDYAEYEADPDGELVVIFGTLGSGIEAFGPYSDHGVAVEFADKHRDEYDAPYEIFDVSVEPALQASGDSGFEPN